MANRRGFLQSLAAIPAIVMVKSSPSAASVSEPPTSSVTKPPVYKWNVPPNPPEADDDPWKNVHKLCMDFQTGDFFLRFGDEKHIIGDSLKVRFITIRELGSCWSGETGTHSLLYTDSHKVNWCREWIRKSRSIFDKDESKPDYKMALRAGFNIKVYHRKYGMVHLFMSDMAFYSNAEELLFRAVQRIPIRDIEIKVKSSVKGKHAWHIPTIICCR